MHEWGRTGSARKVLVRDKCKEAEQKQVSEEMLGVAKELRWSHQCLSTAGCGEPLKHFQKSDLAICPLGGATWHQHLGYVKRWSPTDRESTTAESRQESMETCTIVAGIEEAMSSGR